jgi:hypothetical protein
VKPDEIEPPWVWDEALQVLRLDETAMVVSQLLWTEGPNPKPFVATPLRVMVPKWAR